LWFAEVVTVILERRWRQVLVGAAVLAAGSAALAGPALGIGQEDSQPPPGTHAPATAEDESSGTQPQGPAIGPSGTNFAPSGTQPANLNPQRPGPPTQYAPDEPASGAKPQPDRGVKGLPVQPE
jgi:hypothetical protein